MFLVMAIRKEISELMFLSNQIRVGSHINLMGNSRPAGNKLVPSLANV